MFPDLRVAWHRVGRLRGDGAVILVLEREGRDSALCQLRPGGYAVGEANGNFAFHPSREDAIAAITSILSNSPRLFVYPPLGTPECLVGVSAELRRRHADLEIRWHVDPGSRSPKGAVHLLVRHPQFPGDATWIWCYLDPGTGKLAVGISREAQPSGLAEASDVPDLITRHMEHLLAL